MIPITPISVLQSKAGVTADGGFGPKTFKAAATYFGLTDVRAAHFFAQTSHETGGFKMYTENLNYSATGLRKTFGKYFPTNAVAAQFERQPEKIANKVYANRMGNGSEQSGDGWKFRGRGALQLTGRENYQAFASFYKRPDVMENPGVVALELAFESAMFYFNKNKLWTICDKGINDAAIKELTKRINGGFNGLEDRIAKTYQYASWK